jgi:AcrR family transcriptional regulator
MIEGTTRQRRHARTRQEILEAALEILIEDGPDKLSMREIARRVDYSPAGLYEYFENKEEIIVELCAEGDRRLRTMLQAVPETLPPDEYLIEIGMVYIRYARENQEHFMLNFSRLPQFEPDEPVPIEKVLVVDETFNILLNAIKKAIEAGVIHTRDDFGLLEIAYGMFALAHGMAVLQLLNMRNIEFDFEGADRANFKKFVQSLGDPSKTKHIFL